MHEALNPPETETYIVIGSGMGGGMVARQLIQNGKKVVLFETGKLDLHTHCLNLSRPHFDPKSQEGPGRDNEVFFNRVKSKYDVTDRISDCEGGSVFALGGRSTFWSLETPPISRASAKANLHQDIVNFLYDNGGYTKALRVMTNSPPGDAYYPKDQDDANSAVLTAIDKLNEATSEYRGRAKYGATLVQNGAEFAQGGLYYFPQKAYSTVDYLLEAYIKGAPLSLWTENTVVSFSSHKKPDEKDKSITKLHIKDAEGMPWDLPLHNGKVILCAGTVNSAAIALRSKLNTDQNLVGKGLTDHEIWMVRYWKESESTNMKEEQPVELSCHVKVLDHWALLTVCTDAERFYRHGFATGEADYKDEISNVNVLNIMFEFKAHLNENGKVELNKSLEPVLTINRERLDTRSEFTTEIEDIAAKIRKKFGFPSNDDQNSQTPKLAGWGAVAHEVGTMRMDGPEGGKSGVVDKNLKVHGYRNLYVCDLSVFNFVPMANPSLTLTALAMRLGDHLSEQNAGNKDAGNKDAGKKDRKKMDGSSQQGGSKVLMKDKDVAPLRVP
ncbi:hypothetical protein BDR22DRAFT_889012 [Usnea florida]